MQCVVLHDIRSAHNVGSIFRTADGAGVEKIYLTGYTPTPVDRFGRAQQEIQKTSLGATETVSWETHADIVALIHELKQSATRVVAVEQHKNAISFDAYVRNDSAAYIFGNEIEGLPEAVINAADTVIELPMRGKKESLNVAVCAGIILYGM